jgi:hypothetical protein
MKKSRNLMGVLAVASTLAVLVGCADEGGDDGGAGNQNPPAQDPGPGIETDLFAPDKVYTLNLAGQNPITLTFPVAGNYQLVQDGAPEIGTYSGAVKAGPRWQLDMTPAAGQRDAREGVLVLTWTGADAGTVAFTPAGEPTESGTFNVVVPGPGPVVVEPPIDDPVTGRTLQINYAGGGGDKFQFTSATAVSWENGTSAGTYTVNATQDNIDVILSDGQIFDITLSGGNQATVVWQQGNESGTFTGTYTVQ